MLNTIVAESLDYIATKLEKPPVGERQEAERRDPGRPAPRSSSEHGAVIFNGDSYSDEWHDEAEKRGLPNLKTAVDALPVLQQPRTSSRCSTSTSVLTPRELHSRYEIYLEQYCKTVNIEANLTAKIAKTMILPGGAPLPERAGRERRRRQGRRLHARHHDARRRSPT